MSPSVSRRRQPVRTPRPSQGRSSRMVAFRSALIVTAVWSIAAGAYFTFRDEATNPTTEMQSTYEKHIGDLRSQFDRTMKRQLLVQEQLQQQLNELVQRQTTLEQHASALSDDQSVTGSINAKAPAQDGIGSGPPVAQPPSAPAVSTRKSASVRYRQGPRANRRTGARPQQHAADQATPAAAQPDLGQRSFAPE